MTSEEQPPTPPSAVLVSPSLLYFPFFQRSKSSTHPTIRRSHSFFENIFVDVVNLARRHSMLRVNRYIHACMAPYQLKKRLRPSPFSFFHIFPKKSSWLLEEPGKGGTSVLFSLSALKQRGKSNCNT